MSAEQELQATPNIISTVLYAHGGRSRSATRLRHGDRITYCKETNTLAFSRDGTYLQVGGSNPYAEHVDDKFLVPPGMDSKQLIEILCAVVGFNATPVGGISLRYQIWELTGR